MRSSSRAQRSPKVAPDSHRIPSPRARPATTALTWLGHATVLIELDGVRLLTDPVLRDRIGPLVRIAPSVDVEALGHIDCILLSHLHADHAHLPSLRDLADSTAILAPRGAGPWLTRHGFEGVRELRPGSEVELGGLRVTATPAAHAPRRRPLGPAAEPIGYIVRGSRSIYFAGDTDLFAAMSELRGTLDVALLPVSGWGSRLGPGHLDPERAAAAVATIEPAVAIPIHWGTLALGRPARRPTDPQRPAREFVARADRAAPGVHVRVLAPGERTEL